MFAVVWPLTILGGVWTVLWTRRRPPQPATTEYRWLVLAAALQFWSVWLAGRLPSIADAVTGAASFVDVLVLPVTATAIFFIVGTTPLIFRYESQYEDFRRYTLAWVLVALGIASLAVSPLVPARYSILLLALGFAGLVFGLTLGIMRFYDL